MHRSKYLTRYVRELRTKGKDVVRILNDQELISQCSQIFTAVKRNANKFKVLP